MSEPNREIQAAAALISRRRLERAAASVVPEYETTYEAAHERVLEAYTDFHKVVERIFPTGTVTIQWKHEPIFHVVVNGVAYGTLGSLPNSSEEKSDD